MFLKYRFNGIFNALKHKNLILWKFKRISKSLQTIYKVRVSMLYCYGSHNKLTNIWYTYFY